jgi:hypothetical protein
MLKVLAWLRSLFLVFVVGYALIFIVPRLLGSMTYSNIALDRCVDLKSYLGKALWMTLAWIAFETAVGWWLAVRSGRKVAPAAPSTRPAP